MAKEYYVFMCLACRGIFRVTSVEYGELLKRLDGLTFCTKCIGEIMVEGCGESIRLV